MLKEKCSQDEDILSLGIRFGKRIQKGYCQRVVDFYIRKTVLY